MSADFQSASIISGTASSHFCSVTASTASYPVPAAGDSFKVIIGKIAKFFSDIKGAITNISLSGRTLTWTKADGTTGSYTTQDTTYGVVSKTANGLAPQLPNESTTTKYLRQDGSWQVPPNTTYSNMTAATASAAGKAGLVPAPGAGKQGQFLRGDGTWQTPTNTTYSAGSGLSMSGTTINHGASVTAGTAGTSSATSGRNTLAIPYVTYNNTGHVTAAGTHTHTIANFAAASSTSANGAVGLVPAPSASNFNNRALMYLRSDGGWQFLPLQNNATTTATGYALDARMGKTLQANINTKNPIIGNVTSDGKTVNVATNTDTNLVTMSLPAGSYIIFARVDFAPNNNGRRWAAIVAANGSTWDQYAYFNTSPVQGFYTTQCMTDLIAFNATRTVAIRAWQDSGSTLSVNGTMTYVKLK